MIGTLVLCMMCLCICIIVLNHKLNTLRRDFEEESSRERTVRNIAVNEERCTRRRQLKELRQRVYNLDRRFHNVETQVKEVEMDFYK